MERWRQRIEEAVWLAAAACIPLIVQPYGCSAFELPKAALLRALVLLAAPLALARALEGGRARVRHPRWLSLTIAPALLFGLAQAAATLASTDPRASLWGAFERAQGLLTSLAYLGLYLFVATRLHTRAQVDRLLRALAWGSAPVVAYGLVQALGLDPLAWQTDAASPIVSTIGRANFLGSYLVLVAPLTAARALLERRWRWAYGLLFGLQVLLLGLTQARAAWVGAGAAAAVGALTWAYATRSRRVAWATAAAVVLALILLGLLNWADGPLAALADLRGLDRLATLARTDAGSTAARITIWRATLPLIAERPWLGYGPETMRPVFARVYPPQLVYYQGRQVVVDRAHNLWLDLCMGGGLASALAYAALLAGAGILIGQGARGAGKLWARATWSALAAATAGHLLDLQFSFDQTASATVSWLLLGVIATLGRGVVEGPVSQTTGASRTTATAQAPAAPQIAAPETAPRPIALLPYLLPAAAVVLLVAQICARPLLADAACGRGLARGDVAAGARAVRLWPWEPVYRLRLAQLHLQAGDVRAAEEQLGAALALAPDDPSLWAVMGDLYMAWGETAPEHTTWAEAAYRRATELAPNVAAYHVGLGISLARGGRVSQGVRELERAVSLDATDWIAYRYLADLYGALGRDKDAARAAQEAARWESEHVASDP
ncbi:MAG: O-antigen ligase family protein [Anaerolineae bacterium]|nr:O-antigen ligase family protein [Anaerolineae bacterium]